MQQEDKKPRMWSIEVGFYPGILFGVRSYDMGAHKVHVLYVPFIDIAYYHSV